MRVLLVLFCVLLTQGSAFVLPTLRTKHVGAGGPSIVTTVSSSLAASKKSDREAIGSTIGGFDAIRKNKILAMGLLSGCMSLVPRALAETEIEMAELPPPYIPVVFGLVLIVGVGLLTGSLGDVIDEESQLGMQSGARARKEIERTRSSYFKKK